MLGYDHDAGCAEEFIYVRNDARRQPPPAGRKLASSFIAYGMFIWSQNRPSPNVILLWWPQKGQAGGMTAVGVRREPRGGGPPTHYSLTGPDS